MRRGIVVVALGAVSCAAALGEPVAQVHEPVATRPSEAVIPDAVVREPEPRREWELATSDILLQRENVPTFSAAYPGDPFEPFGRVPEVTLYDDGTIIYEVDSGVMVYRIGKERAARQLAHVVELGIREVRSKDEACRMEGDAQSCLSDGGIVVLRVRGENGELRELRNAAGWADEREATLHAVYDRLKLLQQPHDWEKRPYVPEHATLFLAVGEVSQEQRARAKEWPLDEALVLRVIETRKLVVAIDAATIATLAAAIGTNATRHLDLRQGDTIVSVALVPWLPGVDYPALERWP